MALTRRASLVPIRSISVDDPFWSPRLKRLSTVTLPQQFEQIANTTGRLRNFKRAAASESGGHEGRYYDDSDVYKWAEAAAYAMANYPHEPLKQMLNEVVEAIVACQQADGYISTYFQLNHPDKKFLNLSYLHEMYCMGHLIEAGVALDQSLGDKRLLDVSVKVAELLWSIFGPGKRNGYCGHQEVELALIRLSDYVNEPRYRELATLFIERRGHQPTPFEEELKSDEVMALSPWANRYLNLRGDYFQDHAPIREHRIVVGHAVRAMYMYTAAAQIAGEDEAMETALRSVWHNMTAKRMYITGGIGSTGSNEGFTNDYDLPNYRSYAETCAAVGLALWGSQMFQHSGESDFIDVAERAIFNGALAGLNLAQNQYFYANPLESRRDHERVDWFDCACCPPNVARLIGSIGTLALATSVTDIYVNLPIGGTYATEHGSITIAADYPRSSSFSVSLNGAKPKKIAVHVRIPEWCDEATFEIANVEHEAEFEAGYAVFDRVWSPGETLTVDWNATPKWVEAHPGLFENLGKAALTYGPLVMCLEETGANVEAPHFAADNEVELEVGTSPFEGLPGIDVPGYRLVGDFGDRLYGEMGDLSFEPAEASFIPYFAWANRGKSSMSVWIRQA